MLEAIYIQFQHLMLCFASVQDQPEILIVHLCAKMVVRMLILTELSTQTLKVVLWADLSVLPCMPWFDSRTSARRKAVNRAVELLD